MAISTLCLLIVILFSTHIDANRSKRMFALCPPHFIRIGSECYFISENRVNWLDAHFECKDRNSRLAEPFKMEDRFLRKYLNRLAGPRPADVWIGARFNWERNKWQWGHNGKDLTYQSFSQMSAAHKDLKFHCAVLKPDLKYRWSASSCELQHQYICQHRMPYVNEKNRQKIYNKWNETYPNEMANEIEIVLSEDDLLRRRRKMHRSNPWPNGRQINNDQNYRKQNDIPLNDIQQSDRGENATKRQRWGNNRPRNFTRQFDLNRNRAGGIRQQIQFYDGDKYRIHQRRQKPKSNQPLTTTEQIRITTTTPPSTWRSNEVNPINEQTLQNERDQAERIHHENELRRSQERIEILQRQEKQRAEYEEQKRAAHQRELEKRHQALQEEQKRIVEQERAQERIKEQRKQHEMQRNRQNDRQSNRETNQLNNQPRDEQPNYAIQTNEIDVTTTPSRMERRRRRKKINDRLNKLSPEDQALYFKRREERNKKRGINNKNAPPADE